MVVAVRRRHVEHHAAKQLRGYLRAESEAFRGLEQLGVVVRPDQPEVEVGERAQALDVDLGPVIQAVEASRHEMRSATLREQTARGHLDPGRFGHQSVGVLDPAVVRRLAEVEIGPDAVELQEPRLESGIGGDLTGAHLARRRIPRDHGLRACAARGGPHRNEVEHRLGDAVLRGERPGGSSARSEYQLGEVDRGRLSRLRPPARPKFERSDPARREVGKTVEWRDRRGWDALGRKVRGGERIAEGVGERVGEQGR